MINSITPFLFIGGGNMASAMISGFIKAGIHSDKIIVVERNQPKRAYFEQSFGIKTYARFSELVNIPSHIILAVKPQDAKEICFEVNQKLSSDNTVISIMAGISIANMAKWLTAQPSIIRIMPNMPVSIGKGVIGLCSDLPSDAQPIKYVTQLMQYLGKVFSFSEENEIENITAIAGSGPAYLYYFLVSIEAAAKTLGFEDNLAKEIVLQTNLGALELALQEKTPDMSALMDKITSKGGTTQAALKKMDEHHLTQIIVDALLAAKERAKILNAELENQV